MKGIERIPSQTDLVVAYEKLSKRIGSPIEEADLLALYSQWARFDPRLAEVIVSYAAQYWKEIAPAHLNEHLSKQPWPSAMGVLLETIQTFLHSKKRPFFYWKSSVMDGIEQAPDELFFIGLRSLGGRAMNDDVLLSQKAFLRWGYFGREILINKAAQTKNSTLIPLHIRRRVLSEMVKEGSRITVRSYVDRLGGGIGLRQAQRDISSTAQLKAVGQTRGRFYTRVRALTR